MIAIHCCPAKALRAAHTQVSLGRAYQTRKVILNKPDGIGVPIGRMSSQRVWDLYINDEVIWLNEDCGIRTTVFMDDGDGGALID